MLSLQRSLVLALCMASLFPGSLGLSSRPAWATVMGDVPRQDQGIGTGSQCSYQPCPEELLQPSSSPLTGDLGGPNVTLLRWSCLCLPLGGLLLLWCLCRKAKRHPREEIGQTPSAPPGTCCQDDCSCEKYKLICRLKENPDLMKKFLGHLQKCYLQESMLQTYEKKEVRQDLEEKEKHFPD